MRKTKRIITLLLSLALVVSIGTACSNQKQNKTNASQKLGVYAGYNSETATLVFSNTDDNKAYQDCDEKYGDIQDSQYTDGLFVPWVDACDDIVRVSIENEIKPKSTEYWFHDVGNHNMKSLDLTNLNTEDVENMDYMFSYCGFTGMESLNLGDKFDASNVTSMRGMFESCGHEFMTTLDLGDKFDTSKVIDMESMFSYCGFTGMESLNLGDKFDTSNVTSMRGMFEGCGHMFMTTLDLGDKFDTSKVIDMTSMFYNCGMEKLSLLKLGDKFNTSNTHDVHNMFENCGSKVPTTIYLGNFNTNENISYSTEYYENIFSNMNPSDKLYVNSSEAQSWIAGLSSEYRPSEWTTTNNILLTSQLNN